MLTRTWAVAVKELRQLRRDRLTLAMTVVLPLVQLLLFGYAINTDIRDIPTVVYDQDRSAASRDLYRSLEATGFYHIVGQVERYDEIERSFRTGVARVALVVPEDFARRIGRAEAAEAQLLVDGADPLVVASATNTAAGLARVRTRQWQARAQLNRPPRAPRLNIEPAILYNPNLRTAIYIVPALVGVILTMTMVMLTSMALARERERGTLEQLMVSPVRRWELVLGKISPYVVIGYVQMTIIWIAGYVIFDVPLRGSPLLLYALAFLFIAANLALGLVFSTIAKSQQQAMQLSFFFLLPNILLSGFMFPFEAMPRPAQWLAEGLPLTHFLRIVRGIALKGSGLAELAGELFWLSAILGFLLLVAAGRVSKRLA